MRIPNILQERGIELEVNTPESDETYVTPDSLYQPSTLDPSALQIKFNGRGPMTLQDFISKYAKRDEEANQMLAELLRQFKADQEQGIIPKVGQDKFPRWLISKYGGNNPTADIVIVGDRPPIIDDREAKHLASNWGFDDFANTLEEGLSDYYGPAESIELMASWIIDENEPKKDMEWAKREIRDFFKKSLSGNGATSHDRLNDMTAMLSALSLYIDPDVDEEIRNYAATRYEKVVRQIRIIKNRIR